MDPFSHTSCRVINSKILSETEYFEQHHEWAFGIDGLLAHVMALLFKKLTMYDIIIHHCNNIYVTENV